MAPLPPSGRAGYHSDMPVTPEQMRAFLERKARRQQEERERLHAEAAADARRIVELIAVRYRPARIVQWGSVLDGRRFQPYSDIDLAVEGVVDAQRFFALLADAEQETRFPVDIVQLERMEPEFREVILEKGQVVYERNRTGPAPAERDR